MMMKTEGVARLDSGRGVYDARRAAALAGIPITTLHYWARRGVYVPSVSPGPRVRQWSWADLLALRAIDFFRRSKGPEGPKNVSMQKIRDALSALEQGGLSRSQLAAVVAVSHNGELFITGGATAVRADRSGQGAMPEVLALVRPYRRGPDLLEPRPCLRIVPGKLYGEPHLVHTRIPSAPIYVLHISGYGTAEIQAIYREAEAVAIQDAIDLENSLATRAA